MKYVLFYFEFSFFSLQAGRFCYKPLNTPICCEGEERIVDDNALIQKILLGNKNKKEESIGWNILKYTPLTTAQRQLQQSGLSQQNDNRLGLDGSNAVMSPIHDGSIPEVTNLFIRYEIADFSFFSFTP